MSSRVQLFSRGGDLVREVRVEVLGDVVEWGGRTFVLRAGRFVEAAVVAGVEVPPEGQESGA